GHAATICSYRQLKSDRVKRPDFSAAIAAAHNGHLPRMKKPATRAGDAAKRIRLLIVGSIADQNLLVRVHIDNSVVKAGRGHMPVQIEIVGHSVMPSGCNPRSENLGA